MWGDSPESQAGSGFQRICGKFQRMIETIEFNEFGVFMIPIGLKGAWLLALLYIMRS